MIIFNAMINFLEAFLFAFFIAYYFDFSKKKKYIFISTIIQFIVLEIFQLINYSGFILTFLIILINLLTILIYDKQLTFNQFFITILYNGLILLCAISSLLTINLIFNILKINDAVLQLIVMSIFAKILLIVVTLLILQSRFNINLSLELYKWKLTIAIELLLVCALCTVGYSILISSYFNYFTQYILLAILFIISILFLIIIHKIDHITKEKIELAKVAQEAQFNKVKYHTIYNLKNEIDAIDHRLFYIIFSIDQLLKEQKYDEMTTIIHNYKNTIVKHKTIINTGNTIFDVLYSLKINDLISKGININHCVFITRNDFYDDFSFINCLSRILDFYQNCNLLEITINEINNYVIIKISHEDELINITDLKDYLNTLQLKYRYHIQNNKIKELKISIKLGEFNEQ